MKLVTLSQPSPPAPLSLHPVEMMTQNQSRKYVISRSNNIYKHNLNQSFVLSKNANLGFLESITVPKL